MPLQCPGLWEGESMDWRIPLPQIRAVDPAPAIHKRQPVYHLRDPLQLAEVSILLPQELGAILMLCDGTRTLQAIQTSLMTLFGIQASLNELKELFDAMDEALLFDNRRFHKAHSAAIKAYREAPFRPLTHAGVSYPADPDELNEMLGGFKASSHADSEGGTIRGIISPHIDFARGGDTYAAAFRALGSTVDELELVIIFGTDHHGGGETYTLSRQDYATPYGTLPTYQPGVDTLMEIYGEEEIFSGELRHRTEHSIEFAATWLHYSRGGESCPILPVLCDALPVGDNAEPLQSGEDARMQSAHEALRELIKRYKTLVIAAGDLSHVGPAFGGAPVQDGALDELSSFDHELLEPVLAGDAEEFHRRIRANHNQTNVCGTAPIVHTLKVLTPTHAELTDYQQCAADLEKTSWVTICAASLR